MIPRRRSRGIDESHTTVGVKGGSTLSAFLTQSAKQAQLMTSDNELRDVLAITTNWKPGYRRCASGCCHSCLRRTPRSLRHLN
jgi:hypothetical protein